MAIIATLARHLQVYPTDMRAMARRDPSRFQQDKDEWLLLAREKWAAPNGRYPREEHGSLVPEDELHELARERIERSERDHVCRIARVQLTASRGVVGNQRRASWWRQVMARGLVPGAGSLSRGG